MVFGAALAFTALARSVSSAAPQTLDRVVAAVGRTAITASDVRREYALEYFLEHGAAPEAEPDGATRERVRDQLIHQQLLEREAESDGASPWDDARDQPAELAAVRKRFPNAQDFATALRSLGMDERQFTALLVARERSLEIIDEHLRPLVSVEKEAIEQYYRQTFLPEFAKRGAGNPPSLAEVEPQIREILVQQKVNEMLPAWLEGLRASHRVEVYGPA